jgi:hypothetical protein
MNKFRQFWKRHTPDPEYIGQKRYAVTIGYDEDGKQHDFSITVFSTDEESAANKAARECVRAHGHAINLNAKSIRIRH